ncbi:hypothetical protein Lal_00043260 [Lupinus albus]|nr:hypothetical protein Lal_00043260 [Lupinus albus]
MRAFQEQGALGLILELEKRKDPKVGGGVGRTREVAKNRTPILTKDRKSGHYKREYLSSSESNDIEALQGLTTEFLNSLRTSGLPNHKIKLKVGTSIMLLRNLDQTEGLCNGTRMIVNRLANHVIEAKVMTEKNVGKIFYIPRMSLSPSHSPWPFKLTRRQFPLTVSYVMTINKS